MTNEKADREVFRGAIEENIDALFGVARRLTRNNADADDLVGETVVKAWAAFDSLDNRSRFRPWIFRILHNCCVSGYRRKQARPVEVIYCEAGARYEGDDGLVSLLEQMPDEFLVWWGNPEQEYINKLLGEEIAKAIENLPDAFKLVVTLINVEGFSYDEAAEILGIPTGTVRSRMKRGRTLLQKNLWDLAKDAGFRKTEAIEEKSSE